MTIPIAFLKGRNISLRPLEESDFTDEYLMWLNDPEVNAFSQRRPFPITREAMPEYKSHLESQRSGYVLAIIENSTGDHVGNVALVNIQPIHRRAEITILVGKISAQGRHIGREAIYLVSQHAFAYHNLHKIFAGTFNPAAIKCFEALGWKKEGIFKDQIWSNGKYHDQTWLSVLNDVFEKHPEFEEI